MASQSVLKDNNCFRITVALFILFFGGLFVYVATLFKKYELLLMQVGLLMLGPGAFFLLHIVYKIIYNDVQDENSPEDIFDRASYSSSDVHSQFRTNIAKRQSKVSGITSNSWTYDQNANSTDISLIRDSSSVAQGLKSDFSVSGATNPTPHNLDDYNYENFNFYNSEKYHFLPRIKVDSMNNSSKSSSSSESNIRANQTVINSDQTKVKTKCLEKDRHQCNTSKPKPNSDFRNQNYYSTMQNSKSSNHCPKLPRNNKSIAPTPKNISSKLSSNQKSLKQSQSSSTSTTERENSNMEHLSSIHQDRHSWVDTTGSLLRNVEYQESTILFPNNLNRVKQLAYEIAECDIDSFVNSKRPVNILETESNASVTDADIMSLVNFNLKQKTYAKKFDECQYSPEFIEGINNRMRSYKLHESIDSSKTLTDDNKEDLAQISNSNHKSVTFAKGTKNEGSFLINKRDYP